MSLDHPPYPDMRVQTQGDLSVGTSWGALGPICAGSREFVRRIFVTVRDETWSEVPPVEWLLEGDLASGLRIKARHTSEAVDFSWAGTLRLSPANQTIDVQFAGEALRDMSICRLGLVVLLPVDLVSGSRLRLTGPSGQSAHVLGDGLAPQRIVDGLPSGMTPPFSAIDISSSRHPDLSLHFTGDLFEIEDQRNWGDASFKIYCTPLSLGFPRAVARGASIGHGVTFNYQPVERSDPSPPLEAEVEKTGELLRFPAIGRAGLQSSFGPDLCSFVSLELDEALCAARKGADLLARDIDLGLSSAELRTHGPEIAGFVDDHRARLLRIRLSGDGANPPRPEDIDALRALLAKAGLSDLPVFAATRGYFVEFNRDQPLGLAVDGLAIPVSPTVHSQAVETAMENGSVVAAMIETARCVSGISSVAVSPLAWRYPSSDALDRGPWQLRLWTLAALLNAAKSGATSVALGADATTALQALARPSALGPVLSQLKHSTLLRLGLRHPDVTLLAIRTMDGARLLFAVNLGRPAVELRLPPAMRLGEARAWPPVARSPSSGPLLHIPPRCVVVCDITAMDPSIDGAPPQARLP